MQITRLFTARDSRVSSAPQRISRWRRSPPPTVDATGTWVGTTDGPDVTHTCTYTLNQSSGGIVSGAGTITTPFTTVSELVVGTVNGDTLMLYAGTVCGSCTLNPLYRGIISSSGSRVDGSFILGGVSPIDDGSSTANPVQARRA